MARTGDKLMSVLIDSLSVEELETLLEQKKNAGKPKQMTYEQEWTNYYREEIIKQGILHLPDNKV